MDKETLSNYGWIVVLVLVLSILLAMATPFGNFIKTAVQNTTQGLFDVQQKAMGVAGLVVDDQKFEDLDNGGSGTPEMPTECQHTNTTTINTSATYTGDTYCNDCNTTIATGEKIQVELTTLTAKSFNIRLCGTDIWTDGTNIYSSSAYYGMGAKGDYVLNGDTWEPKTWNITIEYGHDIWTDGTNIYYSRNGNNYVLNGDTWEPKTWNGFTNLKGAGIWTDGTNIYYSNMSEEYVLNGDTWEPKTWNKYNLEGGYFWTDGINTYYSMQSNHYILNGDTLETKTWNGLTYFYGSNVWTDGINTYYSSGSSHYVLNGDTWEVKIWDGSTDFTGLYIWTDKINYYYSYNSTYVLS